MHRRVLPNGLTLLTLREPGAPAVAVQAWVRVGSADERVDGLPDSATEHGLAHVHEHMLFKGTERRGVGRIAYDVEAAGGDINAYTSFDQTVYHLTVPSRHLERGLDVIADAVQHSAFDPTELERELEVIVEEIKRAEDAPGRVASQLLFRSAYTRHPYGRPVIGTVASVRSFTREHIVTFYRRWYTGRNLVVVAVGDLDEHDAAERIAALFSSLPAGEVAPARAAEPVPIGARFISERSRFEQSFLHLAVPIPGVRHEDVAALDVLAMVLGQGESSRLVQSLKRDRHLASDIGAYAYTPLDPGTFMISATPEPGRSDAVLEGSLEAMVRIAREAPSRAEVERARTIIESQKLYERETVQGLARKLGFYETIGGGLDEADAYYRRIAEVEPEDIRGVAERYFVGSRVVVTELAAKTEQSALTESGVLDLVERVFGRSQPPTAPPRRKTAVIQTATLATGERLLVVRDRSLAVLSFRAVTLGGLAVEPPAQSGLSRLYAQTVTRGTARHSAAEIASLVESMAGQLEVSSGRVSVGLRVDVPSRHLVRALELGLDVLTAPAFPLAECEREQALQLEEIRVQADRPAARTMRALNALLYPNHPYGRPVLGTTETVGTLDTEALRTLHRALLGGGGRIFAAVGDIEADELQALLDDRLGALATTIPRPQLPPIPPLTDLRERILAGTGAQAHVALGFHGVTYTSPDKAALDVLLTVLSGQGGRLFLELRDRQSLCYSVSASSFEGPDAGYVYAYMGTSADKISAALSGIETELRRIREEHVTEAELDRARQHLAGAYELSLQRRAARTAVLAYDALYGLAEPDLGAYARDILAVTSDDVLRVARAVLDLGRSVRVVLDPSTGGEA